MSPLLKHRPVKRGAGSNETDPDQPGNEVRRPRGRPAIPLERIVTTALEIVEKAGADALSMRTLADRLGSGTATLYRHFADRTEMVAHVVDRIFAEVQFQPEELESMGWQKACRVVANTMFEALSRHGKVAPLLIEAVPLGPNAMRLRENCIAVLLAGGFPRALAARSYATLGRYVVGFATQINGHGASSHLSNPDLSQIFQDADPDRFPATVAVAGSLPVPLEDEFAFGLDLILTGLAERLKAAKQRHRRRPAHR